MRSFGFVNNKGGPGKTTSALNVAACLAGKGRRVLVVDTDPQGNASYVLLRGEKARRPALYEVLMGEAEAADAIVPTHLAGVDLLPGEASLADATAALTNEIGRERRLRMALEGVAGDYDVAVVDSAPTRSILTVNVLNAVDQVVVPFAPGLFGALGLGQLQADVAQVRRFLDNKRLRIGGIVLTMVDKNNVHRDLEDQLRGMYGDLVFRAKIPRSIKIEESHGRFEPIITYAPKSAGALAYAALTEELMDHAQRQADRDDPAEGDPRAHGAA
jgi:chromosome partitioning protein